MGMMRAQVLGPWYDRFRTIVSSWVFHLFLSGIVMLIVFLHPPKLFHGDFDTALNYLNTIVSSLSTILALCISIILVAIQLTASNYTHRVLDYFVRLPYNGSLFAFYLVTIFRSFFLMSYIRDDPRGPGNMRIPPTLLGLQPVSSYLDLAISADLIMVAICFISLLVYMYAVVQLLKPERIITLILRDYDTAIVRGRWRSALDNVEQICDIAKRAASVSDSATGARCVHVMSEVAARLPLPADRDDPLFKIHQGVVDQWVEMVGVAVKERETGLLRSAIDALFHQGAVYTEGQSWAAAELVVLAYRHIVFGHLLHDGQVFYVDRIAAKLYQLAYLAAQRGGRGQLFCLRTWHIIRYIGECSVSSQPGGLISLMDGLLMVEEVPSTIQCMTDDLQRDCLLSYFQLWKAFAVVASSREMARWANWWAKADSNKTGFVHGYAIAMALAVHVKRPELAKTMEHVWHVRVFDLDIAAAERHFAGVMDELFDGWPWPCTGDEAGESAVIDENTQNLLGYHDSSNLH